MTAAHPPLGHEKIVTRLEAAAAEVAAQGKHTLAHALIFAGPAGVGKFHVARWWATRLKCREPRCDAQCSDCRQLAAGTHADVAIVTPDAESGAIYIEAARDLIHMMAFRPLRPGPRIAIVRDAHELTPQAQSAMLKLLEEPPGFAVLVLVTHNPSALLPTIRSRCLTLRFGALPEDDVRRIVQGCGRSADDARKAAALAGGSAGRAVELTPEQIADRDEMIAAFEALRSGAAPDVEKLVNELVERTKNDRPALAALLEWQMRKVEASLGSGAYAESDRLGTWLQEAARGSSTRLLDEALRTFEAMDALARNGNPRLVVRDLLLQVRHLLQVRPT